MKKSLKIAIINYGMGNLQSVKNAFDFIGINCVVENNITNLSSYDKFVLPGVGAFETAMNNIRKGKIDEAIFEQVFIRKKNILGICLGMQLLLESSSEYGFHNGLSLIKGKVNFFGDKVKELPIPHVGWNQLSYPNSSVLLTDIPEEKAVFYFVHSYFCLSDDPDANSVKAKYGIEFDAILEKDNIFCCQFHPEKSQQSGLKVLKNFSNL